MEVIPPMAKRNHHEALAAKVFAHLDLTEALESLVPNQMMVSLLV